MNTRDTGFRKRACKKRTKLNCHLYILKENNIEIAAPVYSHDNSRYYIRNHFFDTKHSTWLLFVNTQLGLHHITCFKLIHRNPQNGQFGCSSCAAMLFLFLPLIVVSELQLQFCWSAVSKWSYDVRAFGLPIVPTLISFSFGLFEYHLFSVLSNWNLLPKKIVSVWKRNGYPKFIKSRVETN